MTEPRPRFEVRLDDRTTIEAYELEHLAAYVRARVRKPQEPVVDEERRLAIRAPLVLQWRRIPDHRIRQIVEL